MAAARHQDYPDGHGNGARSEQPPSDAQHRGQQIARHIICPGRRLQWADASTDQHPGKQQEHTKAQSDAPRAALDRDHLPEQKVECDQANADQQRVTLDDCKHTGLTAVGCC
ncbi:hypothetical protein D3C77_471850 [compost metagenome]